MPDALLHRIDITLKHASDTGALQPIHTEHTVVRDTDMDFTVRWVSSLAHKDTARVSAAVRRDPGFNPFLPPDPDLSVAPLGALHLAVLNKYPVIARHLLIVTRAFAAQTEPLTRADFTALATVMRALGGLGFFNGGSEAGASQLHKHLQWIPESEQGASLHRFTARLPANARPGTVTMHPELPWQHCFVRLAAAPHRPTAELLGSALHDAYANACAAVGIAGDADPMPPYNLLVTRDWLALIPRSREHHEQIAVNALGFAGSLFVRRPEQIEIVRAIGPLQLLTAVACPR